MLLLILGTIAEHQHGLYYAQQNYFSVYFFLLFGFIPLPGTYTTLTIIFINLLCKLMMDEWRINKLGTLVTHISGLLLLLGGFLTAHFSHEGYIDLTAQATADHYSDYNKQEIAIINQASLDDIKQTLLFDINNPKSSTKLSHNTLNFSIELITYCKHCKLAKTNQNTTYLQQLPSPKDTEQANSIIEFNIIDNKTKTKLNDQALFLNINHKEPYTIQFNNTDYFLSFRSKRIALPFQIQLHKFTATTHPGTEIAKSYESEVSITDLNTNNIKWHGTISMNNPLRYQGYTFYQSSYYVENNNDTSVLAAVYNIGQSFPYIASIILCIGILLHLLQRLPKLLKNY
jgi:hypothetical protein